MDPFPSSYRRAESEFRGIRHISLSENFKKQKTHQTLYKYNHPQLKALICSIALFAMFAGTSLQAKVEIQWWHAFGGRLGELLDEQVNKFNASQNKYAGHSPMKKELSTFGGAQRNM